MELIDALNGIAEFTNMVEFMEDDEFTDSLNSIVKIMRNPDIPPAAAAKLINKLQAYSAKFSVLGSYYVNIDKKQREKKNMYFSMSKALDDLVGALKYTARNSFG